MSCVVTVQTDIRDRAVLEETLKEMGFDVAEGGRVEGHGETRDVDISCGSFGFKKEESGYVFIGATRGNIDKILQEYAHKMIAHGVIGMSGTVEIDTVVGDDIVMEVQVGE